jgi:galactose oxidase-like protein
LTYGQIFTVSTPDAAAVAKVTLLRLSSVTHAFNQEQRINYLTFNSQAGGLSVTAPADRNVCPPGYYMIFILNGNGVPSVARIIRVG